MWLCEKEKVDVHDLDGLERAVRRESWFERVRPLLGQAQSLLSITLDKVLHADSLNLKG